MSIEQVIDIAGGPEQCAKALGMDSTDMEAVKAHIMATLPPLDEFIQQEPNHQPA